MGAIFVPASATCDSAPFASSLCSVSSFSSSDSVSSAHALSQRSVSLLKLLRFGVRGSLLICIAFIIVSADSPLDAEGGCNDAEIFKFLGIAVAGL